MPPEDLIGDGYFMRDLDRLRELRSFLIQEAVRVPADDAGALSFGHLNLLRYSPDGRAPTEEEWSNVERLTQTLFGALTDPLRKRFVLGAIPRWVSLLPLALSGVALASLVAAIFTLGSATLHPTAAATRVLPCYLVWLMSLGAIGAVAFIGMNALSVQQDVTFDLTNTRLMVLRIVLGSLFGLVLTLPFGFTAFLAFASGILGAQATELKGSGVTVTTQAVTLLAPFVLGFSTSLVIMVLNRLIDSVQAFFGTSQAAEQKTASKAPDRGPSRPPGTTSVGMH
jgi:hypothetical protein